MFCLWQGGNFVNVKSEQINPESKKITNEPNVDVQYLKLSINLYIAEDLPHINSGILTQLRKTFSADEKERLHLYAQVNIGDLIGQTQKEKSAETCCWNQQIVFITKFPLKSQSIVIQVRDDDLMVNTLIGMFGLDMNKISNPDSGGFLPTFGPCYVQLHNPKDTNESRNNMSCRGKLLMSVSSEIIYDAHVEKSGVTVTSTMALPEGSIGKEEEFLLFACLRDGMMTDIKLDERKKIRFTLHLGNEPQEILTNSSFSCPFKKSDTEKAVKGNLPEENEIAEDENCSPLMTLEKTNNRYSHLPIYDVKPCLLHRFLSLDDRRRMYIANTLEKLHRQFEELLLTLRECLDFEKLRKDDYEKALRNFEAHVFHFSKILNQNWELFSSKTQLDFERKKIYDDIVKRLMFIAQLESLESERTTVKTVLEKLENVFHDFVGIEEDPQLTQPDVVVWMECNQKRVSFAKIALRDVLHSESDVERGKHSGKIVSMILKPFLKKKIGLNLTKIDLYLWFGLSKHSDYCLKSLPQGFNTNIKEEYKFVMPHAVEYYDKQAYKLKAHIYQARSLPYLVASTSLRFFVQILAGNRCRNTQIKDGTFNPIWDETLEFKNLIFYGCESDMEIHAPEIVLEIYCLTESGQHHCLCRTIIPVSKSKDLPFLRWHQVDSVETAKPPAQLLAAFEIKMEDKDGGDSAEYSEDTLHSFEPVQAIPASIRPCFSRHRIEVLFWGLRELKHVNLLTLEAPRLELEIGGQIIRSSVIQNYRKHSNFVKMVETLDMELPERENYLPAITMRLQDCKSFGRRNVVASHVLYSLGKYVVKAEGDVLEPKFETQPKSKDYQSGDVVVTVESSADSFPIGSCTVQTVEIPWASSKTSPGKGSEEENEEEDWWTRYYISNGEIKEEEAEIVLNKPSKLERRKTLAEVVIGDQRQKRSDNINPKAFAIYQCELENVPEFGGFGDWLHSFQLTSGKRRFTRADKEKIVAIFKGCFRIYKLPLSSEVVDPLLPSGNSLEGLFSALPENHPTKVLVRVYIVKAIGLTPSDITNTADPYIVLQVGDQKFTDKDNYISKQLDPVFGKCFEFVACFPREATLQVRVMDWDLMGSDDLIGDTKIDLENRFYSRSWATCGLPRTYETSGPNAWRDCQTPTEILAAMCKRSGLGNPSVMRNAIRISDIIYNFEDTESGEENRALYLLHRWKDISPGKNPLVPEHLETRTLHHPSKPGEIRGKLLMWVDMFPDNTVPPGPPRDISPRKPVKYELRVIIWNTEDIVLADDAFLTGEKMSDIYVRGCLTGKQDIQCTDVHYRSLTGEGNFNWRFVFPFDYLSTERKIVVCRKASAFSWDESEFKVAPELKLQVWDADTFRKDDYLGEVVLHLHHLPRAAKTSNRCSLDQLREDMPRVSLFEQRRTRGWWPVSSQGKDEFKNLSGKIEVELHLLTREEADKFPVGFGRKPPDALEDPKRPSTSFANYLHPFKTFRYALWRRYRRKMVTVLSVFAIAFSFILFVYSIPGYAAKKLMNA